MMALRAICIVAVIGFAGFLAFAWRSEIPPEQPNARPAFDPALVAKGAQLAAVGNCIACHTVPGKAAFAGGLALPTPFGTIYSTNITPDAETGLGLWSEAAFQRAMRQGVDREGRHLYPAFPYDHYTRVTTEDSRALYAFIMSRDPVKATAPANELPFPFNVRLILAGWKLLFLREGELPRDASKSEAWNRGAYLTEGLGHCGACHTPRNSLGAMDAKRPFAGGEAEGWQAYAINAESPAPVPWSKDSLAQYLRHGWHPNHGVARGPMAEVTGNLGLLPDADIDAIATYVADIMGTPSPQRQQEAQKRIEDASRRQPHVASAALTQGAAGAGTARSGAAIYASACATCHDSGRPQPFGGLSFRLSSAVNAPNPQNIVNVTLFGLPPADGEAAPVMPSFAGVLSDRDMVALLNHLRAQFTDKPAWTGLEDLVRRTRTGEHKVAVRPADGIERAPANVGAEERR
ncbi:cytochrome c [Bosea sp. BK604]|uniref:c-type cytochrome n=1 Tax=Bosea sp. BK604 TaxID=2512180 RepID=UPI00104A0BB3|nr:cytochrome c [Bosea sp. BK604]